MFVQSSYKFVNVSANDFDVHCVYPADFFHDVWLVPSLLYQLQNVRADDIDGEHLAVTNIQKDSAIVGFCTSDCLGGIKHG
jgi:hypothetical protein